MSRNLTPERLKDFEQHMIQAEKSTATIEKYNRDVRAFSIFARGAEITKETVIRYKNHLTKEGYAVRSINSMIASLNSLFRFLGWEDCRVKSLRLQREVYSKEEKELTRDEYLRLLKAAEGKERVRLILETICGTGIRVSEISYFTVEKVKLGEITVSCKNKTRKILLPGKLRKKLLSYAQRNRIRSGAIFLNRNGDPLGRTVIWAMMKKLCAKAKVRAGKVFPHNLRKLFARSFHKIEKDIARLADVLGHSSINTTRIYIMTTGLEHRKKIDQLGLVV